MIEDEVLFTPQLATVVVDLYRRTSEVLSVGFGVSYLEFCLLASLGSHGWNMSISDFPASMVSNVNTVVVAASRLQEKGLLSKEKDPEDKRVTRIEATDVGKAITKEGFEAIFNHLRETVWLNHSDADIEDIMTAFPLMSERLGIGTIERNNINHPVMTPAYLMHTAVIIHRWTQEVKAYSQLSLTEFRCLALLEGRPCALSASQIADTLLLDRSSVTTLTNSLKKKGYIAIERCEDKRATAITLTDKGEVCAALVTAKLSRLTASFYADADTKIKARTNELHMRMYSTYLK